MELLAMTRTCVLKPILAKLVFVLELIQSLALPRTNATSLLPATLTPDSALIQTQSTASLVTTRICVLKQIPAQMVFVSEATQWPALLWMNATLKVFVTLPQDSALIHTLLMVPLVMIKTSALKPTNASLEFVPALTLLSALLLTSATLMESVTQLLDSAMIL